jgi:hypothetical protein
MSRARRKFRFKEYQKTTVFLDPESQEILKALFPTKRYGVTIRTDYINHAIKCLHLGRISPLPGVHKMELPEVYAGIRGHSKMVWKDAVEMAGLHITVPNEWYAEFERESILEGVAVQTLVRRKVAMYLTKEQIKARAVERNVPYNYMYRELLMNVFPNISIVDFGPAQRGNLERQDMRVNKYTIRKGDRRKEERRVDDDVLRLPADTDTVFTHGEFRAHHTTKEKS